MRKISLLALVTCCFSYTVNAQTAEDSVKAVINRLFDAMRNADSKSLTDCFADSAILQSVSNRNDTVKISTDAVKEFADFIATVKKGDADERITFDVIRIDGALAIAWTPYKFYYKGNFSHCGADSYQLVRINGLWKIQYLIDTRRRDNCN
ncbi:nuclear transport factor 2 family protein [Panacibacter ginsenosidivorans]|uniref:Nuclear transport factor 2 family protein n=1 Tax=Panacibacter ginsenosidivorans TaxID=1813871 RepID=A0A5B8VE10_9BACT|nr:nuclear transport factor 2 family protein [Panacibacter ginsenosidivorans]QEC69562.1 nuclear transport factor 2 family protein [Panacibacter ginsenosidivorans]